MHPQAGEKAPKALLEDIPTLIANYYSLTPDINDPAQRVSFGTSGHRGSANKKSFNETHISLSHRHSVITAESTTSPVRYLWGKTPTPSPRRHN